MKGVHQGDMLSSAMFTAAVEQIFMDEDGHRSRYQHQWSKTR